MTQKNRFDFEKVLMLPDPGVAMHEALEELKRCYDLIDSMQGKVPYVEDCEVCGATDGGPIEGCDDCGIIHYESKHPARGFYHKYSPKL